MKNFQTDVQTIINFLHHKFVDTYYVDEEEVEYLKSIIKSGRDRGEISTEVAENLIADLDNLYNMYKKSVKDNY